LLIATIVISESPLVQCPDESANSEQRHDDQQKLHIRESVGETDDCQSNREPTPPMVVIEYGESPRSDHERSVDQSDPQEENEAITSEKREGDSDDRQEQHAENKRHSNQRSHANAATDDRSLDTLLGNLVAKPWRGHQ